ncbi:hypothetical protein P692DRAFT_20828956 [Suillus brevipes Sb2]|nr:hypothetical protein P692DRAFT_20828956 [Suillus brevipes Sb2]
MTIFRIEQTYQRFEAPTNTIFVSPWSSACQIFITVGRFFPNSPYNSASSPPVFFDRPLPGRLDIYFISIPLR